MTSSRQTAQVRALLGRNIRCSMKNGCSIVGKLEKVQGGKIYVRPCAGGKSVRTKALLPLALFDVAALGAAGAYGYGPGYAPYGAYGPYGPYSPYGNFWF